MEISVRIELLDSALDYAARGFHVFPLRPGEKAPAGWLAPHGQDDATTDRDTIIGWWMQCPEANVGIACEPSGLYVIDLDSVGFHRDGRAKCGAATWGALVAEHGEPPRTLTIDTWSGGTHLYYRMPPGVRLKNTAGGLGVDVDTRGNGYVVAPPSKISAYVWTASPGVRTTAPRVGTYTVRDNAAVAEVPGWVVAKLASASPSQPAGAELQGAPRRQLASGGEVIARVRQLAAELRDAPSGQGNDTAARLGFMAGQYVGAGQIDQDEAVEILLDSIAGWTYAKASDARAMENTIVRQVAEGAKSPRPWVARIPASSPPSSTSRPRTRGGNPEPPGQGGEPDIEALIASVWNIRDQAARVRAARKAVAELAGSTVPAADLQQARDALADMGLRKGDFDAIVGEKAAERKAAEKERKVAERAAESAARIEQVEGRTLPSPRAPLAVARALVPRLPTAQGLTRVAWWRGDWYRWTGAHWTVEAESTMRGWLYRETESAVYVNDFDEVRPWNPGPTSVNAVMDAMGTAILQRLHGCEADVCIACTNGVLNPETRTLLQHTPARFNLTSLPYDYDGAATCPGWEAFLEQVLPDKKSRAFLQEWFGYVISGDTRQHKMASLIGPPRCGKGTIGRVLEALLGASAVASPSITKLGSQFGTQGLIGKSLAVLSDVRWNDRRIGEAVPVLLEITGEDSQDVARKNREDWHGRLGIRFMLMSNDDPNFSEASGALAGRMIHCVFTQSFFGREDIGLTERLLAELPGILNWALVGLRRYRSQGRLTVPAESAEVIRGVRRVSSSEMAFIEDSCDLDPESQESLNDLYARYRAWCREGGREHINTKEVFSKNINSAYRGHLRTIRSWMGGQRVRFVVGLRLLPNAGHNIHSSNYQP